VISYKRVALLGSTGFLGRAISTVFRSNRIEIRGYGSAELDLRKPEMFEVLDSHVDRDTALIFASALTPEKGATLDVLHDNYMMCRNVARYLETHPVGLCVYISSDAVYPIRYNPVTEDTPIEPANFYALAKYIGERTLSRVSETTGFPLLIVRATALYGPGDTHGSYGPNSFLRSILQEKTVRIFGEGEDKRDHLHVDDAAWIVYRLVEAAANGVYNVATGQSLSFAEIVGILRKVVPASFQNVSLPRKVPITHRHFDISRLFLQVPGFQFTGIEEGLKSYYMSVVQD